MTRKSGRAGAGRLHACLTKGLPTLAALAAVLSVVPAQGQASVALRAHSCSEVKIVNPTGGIYTRTYGLRADGVSCKLARKVARARLVDDGAEGGRYHGFTCTNTGDGISCHRGHASVRWRFSPGRAAAGGGQLADRGDFLVPVSKSRGGFGKYSEGAGANSAARLRSIFGEPERTARKGEFICAMHWPSLGLDVRLVTYEWGEKPCSEGSFYGATLTGNAWHTASGVRPGISAQVAARHSVRDCMGDHLGGYRCQGVRGYVLGLNPTDCARDPFPSVIAQVEHESVRSLVVIGFRCE